MSLTTVLIILAVLFIHGAISFKMGLNHSKKENKRLLEELTYAIVIARLKDMENKKLKGAVKL